jgi:hypothetical protein
MSVVAYGVTLLAPVASCKDGPCVHLLSGNYLKMPAHDYGQYEGLSISLWFKPMHGCGASARLVDLGNTPSDNIVIGRSGGSNRLEFIVRRPNTLSSVYIGEENTWPHEGIWRHVIWTLDPLTSVRDTAVWKIFIDGTVTAALDGLFPVSQIYGSALVGKGSSSSDGPYVGYMDSLTVFSAALGDNEARLIYAVRLRPCVSVSSNISYAFGGFCLCFWFSLK